MPETTAHNPPVIIVCAATKRYSYHRDGQPVPFGWRRYAEEQRAIVLRGYVYDPWPTAVQIEQEKK